MQYERGSPCLYLSVCVCVWLGGGKYTQIFTKDTLQ